MEINKDVCRRLYNHLCKTIGSEEVVTKRRRFFASVDYFTERTDLIPITSGSRAEGLDMGSDLDIMGLFPNVHISEDRTEDSFLIPNNIVMDTDECKPCFSQLKGYSCHFDSLVKLALTPHGQEYRLESERIRYLLISVTWLFKPFRFHGPCVSDETDAGLCDLTVCLRCPVWINQAKPWIKRERYWPSPFLVSPVSLQISRPFIRIFGVVSLLHPPDRQLNRGKLFIKRFLKYATTDFMPLIVFTQFCQLVGKTMNIHYECPNKLKYKLVKQYLPYLIIGLRVDAVSGWMYLATYYYCIGKYKVSLQLIHHALSECTSDKLFHVNNIGIANNLSEIEKDGIRRKLWKCRHLYKKHVIHEISFYYNSRVIPPELDVQLTTATFIPPLVYIHFLRFLCFFRLNKKFKFKQAILDLRSSIDEGYFNCEDSSYGEACKCLAIALEIYGEKKDAKKYYDIYDFRRKKAFDGFYF
ncbi:unnamed protein product [Mytilus edulis]|uniref:Cyclic GMP-AMP synthase n=2 Tax=Mytilus TaxID=6548 RepID=A0A8S3QFS1_MYTED|nr:unnamed protein product [Mytilus edulis]